MKKPNSNIKSGN